MNKGRKKVLIVAGPSCSGKTAFAKFECKKSGSEYLDFDLLFDYKDPANFESFSQKLNSLMLASNNNSFVLDGYLINSGSSLLYLQEELKADISFALCLAAPNVIKDRQLKQRKGDPLAPESISKETIEKTINDCYFSMQSSPFSLRLIDTSKDGFDEIEIADFPGRWQELVFISELEDMPHDKYYQDIKLPSGATIKGYSEVKETWERLSALIDFKGRSVVDFGPFHGFFCFEIERAGASQIVGVEKNEHALEVARRLSWINNSKVNFVHGDIQTFNSGKVFDVALVLNMLHHVPDQAKALKNVFSCADTVVFEIELSCDAILKKVAKELSFEEETSMGSARGTRKIMVMQRKGSRAVVVNKDMEKKYPFSPGKYRMHRILKSIKSMRILKPLKLLVKKI